MKKVFVNGIALLLAAECTFSFAGCKKGNKPQGTVSNQSYSSTLDEFGDMVAGIEKIPEGYDSRAIDTILGSIINGSNFEGLNNALTLMGFKNNIVKNGLTLSEFIKFDEQYMDENGNIKIETENGVLTYTKEENGNVSAKFKTSKVVENDDYETPTTFDFEATCNYYSDHAIMKVSYNSGDDSFVTVSATYSYKNDGSLKFESAYLAYEHEEKFLEQSFVTDAVGTVISGYKSDEPAKLCGHQISVSADSLITSAVENANQYSLRP